MKKIIILICLLFVAGCNLNKEKDSQEVFNFIDNIEQVASIKTWTIYGKYFNIEGEIDTFLDNLVLILKNNDTEVEYPLIIKKEKDKTIFKTNNLINEGINLDKISKGNYLVLLKDKDNYWTLKNETNYENLEYWTVTHDSKNNKIDMSFKKILEQDYLTLNVEEKTLPQDIYDIVIDPGHGGVDIGAHNGNYYESKITLSYGKLLKEKLESVGYKVKLTREIDESISNYGKNGRVSIPYQTRAKLLLSIHLNSANLNVGSGGVEIYVPYNSNIEFAKNLAKNIVDKTSSGYSKNVSNRIENGVYLRTLTKSDLESMKEDAQDDGYTPYEKANTKSTYYYIIRETGGIVTGAYIDMRNPKKEGNPYFNSNYGCESYLVELGYMNSSSNLNILLNEKDKYVEAIIKSINDYLN